MTTTVTLLAPTGVNPVIAASGTVYHPDANWQITITVPSPDVLSLMEQGCIPVANVSNTVQAGSNGAAGTIRLYPTTASKGLTTITMADNSGNTTNTIEVEAQAGTRTMRIQDPGATTSNFLMQTTAGVIPVMDASGDAGGTLVVAAQAAAVHYTIPDMGHDATFLLSRGSYGASGLVPMEIPLLDAKNAAGTPLSGTPASGNFTPALTPGTSCSLVGENANNNTKTDTAWWEVILPAYYITGQDITVTVHAKYTTAGTVGTKTVVALAYASAADGSQGSNLVATSAATLTTADAAYNFTITGATLAAGQRVFLGVRTAIQETAAGGNIYSSINSVTLS